MCESKHRLVYPRIRWLAARHLTPRLAYSAGMPKPLVTFPGSTSPSPRLGYRLGPSAALLLYFHVHSEVFMVAILALRSESTQPLGRPSVSPCSLSACPCGTSASLCGPSVSLCSPSVSLCGPSVSNQ